MAQATDDEPKRKPRRGEKTATWLMTGMLILGLGGFGVSSFGTQVTAIGAVGKTEIPAKDYARTVQQKIAEASKQFGQQLSKSDAFAFGIDRQALADVLTRAAMDEAARIAGVSVGDNTVGAEIIKQASFIGASGSFDRSVYRETLNRNGWSEAEYEEALRRDVTRSLLQGAVSGGFTAPKPATDTLYNWIAERRGFSMIRLVEADLAQPLATPNDEVLTAWYQAHIERFTRPEAKRLRVASLTPDMILKEQPVDDANLRKIYDNRIDEFVTPERRLVERLIFPDQAAVDAALAKIQGGESFEDLVKDRGLPMDAVDMGDISEAELGAAGPAVFAAAEGGVVSAETDLGPALFRANGTLAGESISFEQAREELAAEIQVDAARRAIADKVDELDDMLAGGTGLEELANQMGMKFETLDHVPGQQGPAPIEGYQAFRSAADVVKTGDFAESVLLDDGGIVALEFVETVAAAPIPFDEAREQVLEAWRDDSLKAALSEQAVALKAKAEAGATMLSLGIVDATPEIARDGVMAQVPASLLPAVFEMAEGELRVVEDGDFIAVVKLDSIKSADAGSPEAEMLKTAIAAQFSGNFSQDALRAFADAIGAEASISLDQTAINAVNVSLQQ